MHPAARPIADGRIGVLFVLDSFPAPKAGTESQVWLLLNSLERKRFRTGVLLLETSAYLDEHLPEMPKFVVGQRRMRSFAFWKAVLREIRAARASGFEVAHIWFNDCALALPIPLRLAGFRVIVSRRDLGFWYTRGNRAVLRINSRFVDRAICNAGAVRDNVIAAEGFPAPKARVIYNGTARWPQGGDRAGFRQQWGIPQDSTLVCLVANLRPLKRVCDAVEAMALLQGRGANVHLAIAGEDRAGPAGSQRHELEALAGRLSVTDRVHFLGPMPDPMPLLEASDIGLLCSETEGLSNALVEYLAAGLPAVCTPVGGNEEVVANGVSGLVVPVADPVAVADALGRLAGDSALRQRFGRAGRQTVQERFSNEAMVGAYQEIYAQLRGFVTGPAVGQAGRT